MGGIGKTQCALEYVYSYKECYERLYWISAVNQTSLFSGFQKIARKAKLEIAEFGTPTEITEAVLSWLGTESNWLIILDNLDDIEIVSGFLPATGKRKHVLITTRNPFTLDIPAEPFEIPIFDEDESIDLFLSRAELTNECRVQAAEIVKELGYLPLAIMQAAAFIRYVTGDLPSYIEQYKQNRKQVHTWVAGKSNRYYPYSVATTWAMSLKVLKQAHPQSVQLLQLFAFLNPDGIQLKFLQAGAPALPDELRLIILDLSQLAKCLIELERASLIRWERVQKSVSIHRLVQKVIKDEMCEADLNAVGNEFLDICLYAFPSTLDSQNRPICREYSDQVYRSLIELDSVVRSAKNANVIGCVGQFLLDDGKAKDSETLLHLAYDIRKQLFGLDDPETLIVMQGLANTYHAQGKLTDASRLEEIVLEKRKQILGDEHPDTLLAMGNLASTYHVQGKLTEAARLQEIVLEKRKQILGDEHPDTLTTMGNLAATYRGQGKLTEAARLEEILLVKRKQIITPSLENGHNKDEENRR